MRPLSDTLLSPSSPFSVFPNQGFRKLKAQSGFEILRGVWELTLTGSMTDWSWFVEGQSAAVFETQPLRPNVMLTLVGSFRLFK